MGTHRDASIVIIGTGFSGLGMAIQLKQAGMHDFVILEKAQDVGGTWRDNTYPGCACDIQSHLYSFSYEQNPDWSRLWAPQQEIWDYLRRCTDKHGIRRHIQFGAKVSGASFDDDTKQWTVRTESGDTYTARAVVAGVGALHIPSIPQLRGIEKFKGTTFHSAEWNHDYDLTGKRVAVIGTGASAIQFVPEIAKKVGHLTLFQRTPAWVRPKPDRAVSSWERRLLKLLPGALKTRRTALFWQLDARAIAFSMNPKLLKLASRSVVRHIAKQVPDPELRAKLTPDYTMGCKRVLISNDYYPTFSRPNVDLVTEGISEVREHSVVTADGVEHEVDAIIYGTGFHVTDAFDYLDIKGRDGVDLNSQWAEKGLETYLGITVSGFPNLFFLLGPNTGLGHNSVVLMIEAQTKYVLQCLKLLDKHDVDAMDVRPAAQDRFNRDIQAKLRKGVWSVGGCKSWYLDSAGVNRTVWPGFVWQYVLRTNRVELADYELLAATRPKVLSR
ncbi:NAD(P)/FAD-dependent oxidoreductase [Kutzneria viridogrisea]|uniref:Monooxygenase n=2 Tax=Kutzneria TaxID=43356 RepID=W5W914_9PSEU|nr:NAD(P)/FAD-dependent oxidoreductase [Kutzneria albida]AHH94659.1 monooxygenase [Kutzneria albida DSM 43870]MBA8930327.1 cation diffusion facilitator CzcD-associated flavoprotein CzcO [Kutzneria viridogrisea]